nr:hypothetical protein [uncultured Methanoregula sp.]
MIPQPLKENSTPLRRIDSTIIGLPSANALRQDQFPGVRMGSDPAIGEHCIIFGNVFIGNRFRCGTEVLIRDNVSIGDNVTINNRSCIDTNVTIANDVTIGEEVWIPALTTIGNFVVINNGVRFIDLPAPAKKTARKSRGVLLGDNCIIGEGAIIGPGVCIGAGAQVEPDEQVFEDVPSAVVSKKPA